ncbi:MAG: dephospho-CoA kinase [Leucobacter sp.]
MTLIGLTGGIASGKSTIGERLEQLGAVRIDADQLAREAVIPGSPGLAQIQAHFGDVILPDGSLDRTGLGRLIFRDSRAREALNDIVHPEVRRLADQRIAEALSADPEKPVVYEVPLLVEADVAMPWSHVVVADAPAEIRLRRLMDIRGLSRDEASGRIASQASDEARRAVADVLIDTGGTIDHTLSQVDKFWRDITR